MQPDAGYSSLANSTGTLPPAVPDRGRPARAGNSFHTSHTCDVTGTLSLNWPCQARSFKFRRSPAYAYFLCSSSGTSFVPPSKSRRSLGRFRHSVRSVSSNLMFFLSLHHFIACLCALTFIFPINLLLSFFLSSLSCSSTITFLITFFVGFD